MANGVMSNIIPFEKKFNDFLKMEKNAFASKWF